MAEILLSAIREHNTAHNRTVTEGASEATRAAGNRGAFADRMISLSPYLSDLEKILAIDKQDKETAQEKYQIQLEAASQLATQAEREEAKQKADLANEEELQRIKEANIEKITELQNRQIETFRQEVGSLFDALTSRDHTAVRNWVRSQILDAGRTITENIAQQVIWPTLQKGLQQVSAKPGSHLGSILQGTPFGPSPFDKSASALTTSAGKLSSAADKLASAAGKIGSGSSSASGGGWGGDSDSDDGSLSGTGIGDNEGDLDGLDSLPLNNGPSWAGNITAPGGSGFSMASIPALAAEGFGAFNGFSKGGVGGNLQGAGSVAAMAGTILPMISSSLSVAGPIGMFAGLGLGLLGGLLGNGPQQRSNQINTELGQAQYLAPTAMNVTESGSGTFEDFGYKGNLRTSNFSPYPQVTNPYVWEQTHGAFGPPPTFYDVPGSQTSQFGAIMPTQPPPPQVTNHYWTVNTMDSQSFSDFAKANHMAIGEAAGKNMQSGHGTLSREVSRAAKLS